MTIKFHIDGATYFETLPRFNETNVHPSPFFVTNPLGRGFPGGATQ